MPKFVCEICRRRFKKNSALEDHLESDRHKDRARELEQERAEKLKQMKEKGNERRAR